MADFILKVDGRATDVNEAAVAVVLAAGRLFVAAGRKGRAAQTARSTRGNDNTQESQQAVKAGVVARRFQGTATLEGASAAVRSVRRRGPLGTCDGGTATSGSQGRETAS